jgi:hypothetical protein
MLDLHAAPVVVEGGAAQIAELAPEWDVESA